ncbi:PREDICTED: protein TIFY 8-like isoform X2 [Lupinus angustifolius]|uniref:protein TIFY 8-like isoform X2 n=1 Tax=Lupinus angustifolius TaxID=3871 RepID=UPI00092ED372|nr:PREDICTED: protein TIFY 8-like isoform X2 [Lupinus angustifolius]
MAHHHNQQQHIVLHDFLGMKKFSDSPQNPHLGLSEPSPSSASRGPFSSSTSDIASEKQVGNHLEGVPFYGPRNDFSSIEIGNRLVGNKRSNSDSTFIGTSRDASQMVPDSFQSSHLMKMLRSVGGGGDRLRRPNDDEVLLGMQSTKPTVASQIFQPLTGTKVDANKWERSILMNAGPSVQHPPRGGQLTPFVHQLASNKIRDSHAGPSFISHSAADEGSRTGIKGPGILNSINMAATATEKISSSAPLGVSRPKHVTNVMDPESSTPPSQQGLTSASRQMTIFYGGQAHVFDDVHPHKADVIMALAGSNGGSWSTAFSPKSAGKLVSDSNLHSGENETGIASNVPLPPELHARLSITGSSSHAIGPGDRVSTPAGANKGSIVAKETRKPIEAAEPSSEA